MPLEKNQIGLSDAVDLGPQQKRRNLTKANSADAARRFNQRIEEAAMTVGRQQLQRLQPERAPQDDRDNQKQAVGISQAERKSDKRKCREMFELGSGKYRTVVNRGQRRVDDESKRQPAGNNGYPLNHLR